MESAPFTYRRVIMWVGRIVLGAIFVAAGCSKLFFPNHAMLWPYPMLQFSVLANISNFGNQVKSYQLLPASGVEFVAHTLPFAEIALGLLLLIGWRFRIWATIITLLMVGFWVVVTRAYLLHMQIDCGCFAISEPITLRKVLEDSAMALLAVLMTVFAFQEARKPHPWTARQEVPRSA